MGAGLRALFAAAALDPAAKQLTGFEVAFRLAPAHQRRRPHGRGL